jgi:hypothetical protein
MKSRTPSKTLQLIKFLLSSDMYSLKNLWPPRISISAKVRVSTPTHKNKRESIIGKCKGAAEGEDEGTH